MRHGAYSGLRLRPRAAEFAAQILERVPVYSPIDEFAIGLAALALARAERGFEVLDDADEAGEPRPERLDADVRGWVSTAKRILVELGATPRARAELAKNLGVAASASAEAARRQLAEHIAERRASGGDGGY